MGGAVEELKLQLQLQRPQTHLDLGYVMLPNLANFGHEPPLQRHHSAPACVHCLAKWQGKVGQSGESVQRSPMQQVWSKWRPIAVVAGGGG